MDGFIIDSEKHRLQEVVPLSGDREGRIVPAALAATSDFTVVNPPVKEGDLIIPLRLFESSVLIEPVTGFRNGLPLLELRGPIRRWIKVEKDVSKNEGYEKWRMQLREDLLLEGLGAQAGARAWGRRFREVLELSGVEPVPMKTIVECQFSMRWGRDAGDFSDTKLNLVRGQLRFINARVKVDSTIHLMNAEAECQCPQWRRRGVNDNGSAIDKATRGYQALEEVLIPRIPEGVEIVDLRVVRICCAYCS